MGCLCWAHARGAAASAPCDATEKPPRGRVVASRPSVRVVGPRFTAVALKPDGFTVIEDRGYGPITCSNGWPLFLIHEAWDRGLDLEQLADGYGPGFGMSRAPAVMTTDTDQPIPACCVGIKHDIKAAERFGVDPCDEPGGRRTWDVVERVSGTVVVNYLKRKDAREEAKRRNRAAGGLCSDPTDQPAREP